MGIPASVVYKMQMISNEPLFQKLVETCIDVLNDYHLMIHPQHWQFFLVHLKELTERTIHERWGITADIGMDDFPPVSKEALEIAKEISARIELLPVSEIRLLAVHLDLAISTDESQPSTLTAPPGS